jgi:hypothetical protein
MRGKLALMMARKPTCLSGKVQRFYLWEEGVDPCNGRPWGKRNGTSLKERFRKSGEN